MLIECKPNCKSADNCENRRIQTGSKFTLERFVTEQKGLGIRTKEPIEAGDFIIEYVGEVMKREEFIKCCSLECANFDDKNYTADIGDGIFIDANCYGNESRFINHSCDPNCEFQKWFVDGKVRMGIFAKKNIKSGEELSYNYNFFLLDEDIDPIECKCGSANCCGTFGKKPTGTISKISIDKCLIIKENDEYGKHVITEREMRENEIVIETKPFAYCTIYKLNNRGCCHECGHVLHEPLCTKIFQHDKNHEIFLAARMVMTAYRQLKLSLKEFIDFCMKIISKKPLSHNIDIKKLPYSQYNEILQLQGIKQNDQKNVKEKIEENAKTVFKRSVRITRRF